MKRKKTILSKEKKIQKNYAKDDIEENLENNPNGRHDKNKSENDLENEELKVKIFEEPKSIKSKKKKIGIAQISMKITKKSK